MVDRVGQQLGNYTIVRKLGEGGFADVYLGEHVHLGTYAAIKVLHTQLQSGDIEKFRSEARTVAHLIHPHIVRVLDFGVEVSTPYLVMDYAANGTLRQRHPRETRLSLPTVVDYVNQIAAGLQYAHDKKLIHRDVKPENMLIGQGDYILLSDFGVALVSQSSRSQRTQEMAGTFAYMAPEQIQGKPRPASDQYALGIVVYEWLTGYRPFYGSLTEIVGQHLATPPSPMHEQVSTISQAVEEVVNIALAKDPHDRYGSVQTFAGELQRVSQQQSSSTHVMSFPMTPFPSLPTATDVPTIPNAIPPFPPTPSISSPSSVNNSSKALPVVSHVIDVPVAVSPVTPVPPFPSNMPVAPITPFPSTVPVSPPKKRRSTRKFMLAGLALLILLLGGLGVYSSIALNKTALVQQQATMTAVASITATAGAKASDVTTYDAAVAANGIMFGFNAEHTHYNPYERILSPANVSGLVQAWTVPTGLTNYSSPVVANGIIYVGLGNYLYAFDAKKKAAFLWRSLTGGPILSSPAVANGVVYVGSDRFYAFDAKIGKPLWSTPMNGGFISSPAVVNGVVYVGSDDDNLYALDAKTGKILWQRHTSGPIDSSPSFDNGVIYVGSKDGNLYAFDANKGTSIWGNIHMSGKIISSPAVANGRVYIVFGDGNLYAYDTKSEKKLWTATVTKSYTYLSPAVANGIVYVGSSDGYLYAFDAISGTMRWKELMGKQIISSPTIANGVVYIGSADGNLYALNAKNRVNLWANPIGVHIESSPAVAYGVVYVVSNDGKLYAFHLPGVSPY